MSHPWPGCHRYSVKIREILFLAVLFRLAVTPGTALAIDLVGPEFQANTYTSCNQDDPKVAVLPSGDFVVVWESGSSAYQQDGSLTGVFGQRFSADGERRGVEFRLNTFTTFEQQWSSISALADGGFVVAWQSWEQDGAEYAVIARRFDKTGDANGSEFVVNTYTPGYQYTPSVTAIGDGFVVVWASYGQDGDAEGVFGQRFDGEAIPVDGEFVVSQYDSGRQRFPHVAVLENDRFVVVWTSSQSDSPGQDGSLAGVFGRVFKANGNPNGPEFPLNSITADDQARARVAGADDGGFIAVWESRGIESGVDVFDAVVARKFDGDGVPEAPEYMVNEFTPGSQDDAFITARPGAGYLVVWESNGGKNTIATDALGVFARKLDAAGQPEGEEFQVNTYTTEDQRDAHLAASAEGYVVVWESREGQDGALAGAFGQRLSDVLCGDGSGDGRVTATDALFSLGVAVGTSQCLACVCDVNGSGSVTATDALLTLQAAVGQPVELICPSC